MERRLVALLGTGAKHLLTAMERGLRAVVLTGIIVVIVVAIATEVVGGLLTKTWFTGATHLAAAALALAFGYAAALTVLIGELIRGFIRVIELIVQEAEHLEKKAAEEIGILGRRVEEEAVKLGRGAVTEAGSLGRTVAGDAGAVGRTVAGVVGGTVGGAEHLVGGAVGGAERAVVGAERSIASRLPGSHNTTTAQ